MKNPTHDLVEEIGDRLVSLFVAKTIREMMGWDVDEDIDKNVDNFADSIVDEIMGDSIAVFFTSNILPLIKECTENLSEEELILFVDTISDEKERKQLLNQIARKFNEENLDAEWARQLAKLK